MHARPYITLCFAVLFALAIISVHAQEVSRATESQVAAHYITIKIDAGGNASFTEQFYFRFFSGQQELLEQDFEENSPSILFWQADYPFVHPHFGESGGWENVVFELKEDVLSNKYLELRYDLKTPFAQPNELNSTPRADAYQVSDSQFQQFIIAGNVNIPSNTTMFIELPANATVNASLLPSQAEVSANKVTLKAFVGNRLDIQYTVPKPIAEPVDASKLVQGFLNSQWFVVVLALLLAGGAVLLLGRETLERKIEDFIVENTEFISREEKEIDVDDELKKAEATIRGGKQ
ncbi:MAG: hypothetical protein HY393_02910 [Candidatus Diapherotrites archaeon]|nr:hypothetical protein [Candidatus Diapherotrites archaeon]